MTRKTATLPSSYFEEKYRLEIDPWQFRTSEYERAKYQATLAALTKSKYVAALEVGCSIGVLTRLLAPRCKNLLAIDTSATAIAAARSENDPNIQFRVATLPKEFPTQSFDLIVLSEVLYYFTVPDLDRVALSCTEALAPEAELILCHWLGETDYPLTGVEASERFALKVRPMMPVRAILHDTVYRLERFSAI